MRRQHRPPTARDLDYLIEWRKSWAARGPNRGEAMDNKVRDYIGNAALQQHILPAEVPCPPPVEWNGRTLPELTAVQLYGVAHDGLVAYFDGIKNAMHWPGVPRQAEGVEDAPVQVSQ